MSTINHINRRDFMKLGHRVLMLAGALKFNTMAWMPHAQVALVASGAQAPAQTSGYGAGSYGQGDYPGLTMNVQLPLIKRGKE
jgi:hypothetical protein